MADCLFCKIIAGEIPARKVYEDGFSLAFLDINPRNPGHTVVISKPHAEDLLDIEEKYAVELIKAVRKVARGVKKATGAGGISVAQSNGQVAGQRTMHIHFHVIPRTEAEKGFGLEEVIPVKKLDDKALEEMARKISSSIPQAAQKEAEPEEEHREEPAREEPEERPRTEPEEPEGEDSPDKQKIDFDF